MERESKVNL